MIIQITIGGNLAWIKFISQGDNLPQARFHGYNYLVIKYSIFCVNFKITESKGFRCLRPRLY